MQNLIQRQNQSIELLPSGQSFRTGDQFIFDGQNFESAYLISDHSIYSVHLNNKQINHCINFNDLLEEYLENNRPDIVYCCYIIEDEILFILFTNGLIITYEIANNLLLKHSLGDINASDDIIDCAQFSHDQELLVIVTRNHAMFLYNKLLVLKRQYNLKIDEYGATEMINVNWGSKETQFHGQGMRDHRIVEEKPVPLNELDDQRSAVDWKHDDYQYVINFVSPKGYRLLKIFNRDGLLQHTSESIPGLQKMIAWKPSGTLIATSQMDENSYQIIFVEKNGLKHGKFPLPFGTDDKFQIQEILWSHDLSVLLICGLTSGNNRQETLMYTENNYKWYLKKRITIENNEKFIKKIIWDEIEHLRLHTISSDWIYNCYDYELMSQTTDSGVVFLIDGNKIYLSDFSQMIIPPPLYTYSIEFIEAKMIEQLFFHQQYMATILNDDHIVIFELQEATFDVVNDHRTMLNYQFENLYENFRQVYYPIYSESISDMCKLSHTLITDDGRIIGCIDGHRIGLLDYSSESSTMKSIAIKHELDFECIHMKLLPTNSNSLLLIDSLNQMYQYDIKDNIVEPIFMKFEPKFDGKISKIIPFTLHGDNQLHYFVLTKNQSLYFDGNLLMNGNVNSILMLKQQYVLFTTIDNKFYCLPITDSFNISELQKNFPPRNLERGSRLLTISELNSCVIVELPRGNLEAFYPRILLLHLIDEYLKQKKFLQAFEILRKNRINLNYICDYNFEMFMENSKEFIEQLGDNCIDYLLLLLFDLSSQNHYDLLKNKNEINPIENKINRICDVFIDISTEIDERKFLKVIILCHVKKNEIDRALLRIYRLKDGQIETMAIKFLLSIVDATKLIEEALGTYDFNILLMVASKSNKDPKEYQMLIDEFESIDDDNYRKYRINLYLNRYQKCLYFLRKCPDKLDETLQLIDSKHLYKDAIEIFDLNRAKNVPGSVEIWNLYGHYLFKKCYYHEAGIAFDRAGNHLQSFKMYVQSGDWNKACINARKAYDNDDDDNYKQLLRSLQQNLVMNGQHNSAAYIAEQYLGNHEESFNILVKGHLWFDALRMHQNHQLNDHLLLDVLHNEMINFYDSFIDILNDKIRTIDDHVQCLKQLHENQSKMPSLDDHHQQQPLDANVNDFETYSETSSIMSSDASSIHSSNSHSSSDTLKTNVSIVRKAKRMEQKKYFLKKGSKNEDIQRIYAMKELINESKQLFDDGSSLIRILYDQFECEKSRQLQALLENFEEKIKNSIDFIWKSDNFSARIGDDEILQPPVQIIVAANRTNYKLILN